MGLWFGSADSPSPTVEAVGGGRFGRHGACPHAPASIGVAVLNKKCGAVLKLLVRGDTHQGILLVRMKRSPGHNCPAIPAKTCLGKYHLSLFFLLLFLSFIAFELNSCRFDRIFCNSDAW
jgi:hypothetical protein